MRTRSLKRRPSEGKGAFPRQSRTVDVQAIEAVKVRDTYCLKCGRQPMYEPHHILTRGAFGPDAAWNMVRLCHECHSGAHNGKVSRRELFDLLVRKYRYEIPEWALARA